MDILDTDATSIRGLLTHPNEAITKFGEITCSMQKVGRFPYYQTLGDTAFYANNIMDPSCTHANTANYASERLYRETRFLSHLEARLRLSRMGAFPVRMCKNLQRWYQKRELFHHRDIYFCLLHTIRTGYCLPPVKHSYTDKLCVKYP